MSDKKTNQTKKPGKTTTSQAKQELTWLKNKAFELIITIPKADIKKAYDLALKSMASSADLPGFRKGKAPASIIEEKVGKNKVYEEVVNILLPEYYQKFIQKHNLRPIIAPRIEPISMEEDKDWQVKAIACEAPDVKLGEYKKIVKGAIAKDKIWVPGKGQSKDQPEVEDKNKKMAKVLQALNEEIKFELADILLQAESDRMLAKLLGQLQKLNISIDQYAQANGKTVAQLKQEYLALAEKNLRTEFIMQQIAIDEKFNVTDKEIEDYLAQIKDEALKQKLSSTAEKNYLKINLVRQKTIDFLLNI